MDRSFGRTVCLGVGLLVVVLLANAGITYRNVRQLDEDARWVDHTHQVLDALNNLLGNLHEAETGQRGYLLSADTRYLEPYTAALSHWQELVDRIRTLTEDNSRQQTRIPRLTELVADKYAVLKRAIDLMKQGDGDGALRVVRSGDGRRLMDDLRGWVEEMVGEERTLLGEREDARRRAYTVAVASGFVMVLLGLVALWLSAVVAVRSLRNYGRAAAARQHHDFLRTTVASLGDGVAVTDADGRVLLLNRVAERLTGWTQAEAAGRPLDDVFRLVHMHTRQTVENPVWRALAENDVVLLADQTALVSKDGTEWPLDDSAAPIRGDDGKITGAVVVFREITDRHRTEQALAEAGRRREVLLASVQEKESYLRSVLDNSPDCIKVLDLDGRLLEMNQPGRCAMGIDDFDPFRGSDWPSLWPEAERALARSAVETARAGQVARFEGVCPTATGLRKHWDVRVAPIPGADGRPARLVSVSRDVTAEKDAESILREKEERFRRAFEDAAIGMALVSPTGRWLRVNRSLCQMIGYTPNELLATDFQTITHPDDLDADLELVGQVLAGAISTYQMEKRYFHKDGRTVHILLSVSLVRGAGGEPLHFISQIEDVTARKEAVSRLRESEERFRDVVDGLAEGVFLLDLATKSVVQANGTFLTLVGHSFEEVAAMTLYDFVVLDRLMLDGEIETIVRQGRSKLGRWQVRRKDGGAVDVDVSASLLTTGGRQTLAVVVRDMSEQKAYEDRLFEYQVSLEEANAKMKALANTDGLTGIKNRAAFDARLAEEHDRSSRYGHSLSVILMDVDHFKLFNDTFGHPAGDGVLRAVADALRATVRTTDFVARYGGEEFVVLLPDTDYSGAMVLAERCRRAVAGLPWDMRPITASVGVATMAKPTTDAATLVKEADQALYRSKQEGRNRVNHGSGAVTMASLTRA